MRRDPFFKKPYLLAWDKILMPAISIKEVIRKVVDRANLQPQVWVRKEGPMLDYEMSHWFQGMSRWCVDEQPEFLSFEDMMCHGVIDVGLTIMIAAREFQDVAICAGVARFIGDGGDFTCLMWLIIRTMLPGWLPRILDLELNYAQQRQLL